MQTPARRQCGKSVKVALSGQTQCLKPERGWCWVRMVCSQCAACQGAVYSLAWGKKRRLFLGGPHLRLPRAAETSGKEV